MKNSFNKELYLKYFKEIIDIDSVSGCSMKIQNYMVNVFDRLGYDYEVLNKGGVIVHIGKQTDNRLSITAHANTIGMMVKNINTDGTLSVCPIGRLCVNYEMMNNVKVYNDKGICFTGTIQKKDTCVQLMTNNEKQNIDFDDCFVVLDNKVFTIEDVVELGIDVGNFIVPYANTIISNEFIKSRFLDNKASVAILMVLLEKITNKNFNKGIDMFFSTHEEIGYGCSFFPHNVSDVIVLDVACMGTG